MIDFYLDLSTGDLSLINNRTRWTKEIQELTAQRVLITLNTNRGEWKFNIDFGVPWLKNENNLIQILGKTPKSIVDAYIKDAILSKDEVVSLDYYASELNQQTREMTIEFEAESINGEIITGKTQLSI